MAAKKARKKSPRKSVSKGVAAQRAAAAQADRFVLLAGNVEVSRHASFAAATGAAVAKHLSPHQIPTVQDTMAAPGEPCIWQLMLFGGPDTKEPRWQVTGKKSNPAHAPAVE